MSTSRAEDNAGHIRLLSYNIRHGEGMDGLTDLERIAGVIRSAEPDVVALQEVDCRQDRTGGVDQAAELGRLTGMAAVLGPAVVTRTALYGNAILSSLRVRDAITYPLAGALEPRSVLSAEVEIAPGSTSTFRFLSTHLSLREESRLRSVSLIESLLDPDEPAVLAGDLNARPESPVLEAFRRTWTNATEGQTLITLPLEKPRQIDYVLFRPARCWAVRHTEVIDERIASDHCPVLADLERLELPEE